MSQLRNWLTIRDRDASCPGQESISPFSLIKNWNSITFKHLNLTSSPFHHIQSPNWVMNIETFIHTKRYIHTTWSLEAVSRQTSYPKNGPSPPFYERRNRSSFKTTNPIPPRRTKPLSTQWSTSLSESSWDHHAKHNLFLEMPGMFLMGFVASFRLPTSERPLAEFGVSPGSWSNNRDRYAIIICLREVHELSAHALA